MTDNNAVDRLLADACAQNRESLRAYAPDFDQIEREALTKLRERRAARRRRAIRRTAVTAAAAAVLFVAVNGMLFFVDFAPARAYRAGMRTMIFNLVGSGSESSPEAQIAKTGQEIKKAQPGVEFQIPTPYWLPDGYLFKALNVTKDQGFIDVALLYESSGGKLEIHASNGPDPQDGDYTQQTLSGLTVFVRSEPGTPSTHTDCYFHVKAGTLVRISGPIDMKTASHLIAEIQP